MPTFVESVIVIRTPVAGATVGVGVDEAVGVAVGVGSTTTGASYIRSKMSTTSVFAPATNTSICVRVAVVSVLATRKLTTPLASVVPVVTKSSFAPELPAAELETPLTVT